MAKIVFFLGNLGLGGVERVLLTYANELVNRGYCVIFVVAKGGGEIERDLSKDIQLVKFGESRVRKAWVKLWKYVHRNRPDYIMTGGDAANIMVIVAALFSRSKVIISQHNYNDLEAAHQGLWSRHLHRIMRLLYPKAYRILAVSQGISDYLVNDVGIKKDRVEVLYNPIDLIGLNQRGKEKPEFKLPEKYILFVGRVSPVKNLKLLLNAYELCRIPDISLVIVGDGSELEILKDYSKSLSKKESILFTGLSHNPIPFIKECSALVLCSFSEAMPTVLLEAMAFDKPIVATPTPGAKEILNYREGTFISNSFDDVSEFASLLEKGVKCGVSGLHECAQLYDMETIMQKLTGMLV